MDLNDRSHAPVMLSKFKSVTVQLILVLVLWLQSSASSEEFRWIPRDCNKDNFVDMNDAIASLKKQFLEDALDVCFPLCDVDRDGTLTVNDPIVLIGLLSGITPFLPPGYSVANVRELCDNYDNDCDGTVDEGCTHDSEVDMLLRWNHVTKDAEGHPEQVKSYRIYFGESPGEYLWVRDSGSSTQYTVRGLRPGVHYYFAVKAYDVWGNEGEYSVEVTGTAF